MVVDENFLTAKISRSTVINTGQLMCMHNSQLCFMHTTHYKSKQHWSVRLHLQKCCNSDRNYYKREYTRETCCSMKVLLILVSLCAVLGIIYGHTNPHGDKERNLLTELIHRVASSVYSTVLNNTATAGAVVFLENNANGCISNSNFSSNIADQHGGVNS